MRHFSMCMYMFLRMTIWYFITNWPWGGNPSWGRLFLSLSAIVDCLQLFIQRLDNDRKVVICVRRLKSTFLNGFHLSSESLILWYHKGKSPNELTESIYYAVSIFSALPVQMLLVRDTLINSCILQWLIIILWEAKLLGVNGD